MTPSRRCTSGSPGLMAANRAALSRRPGSYPRCCGRRIQLADLGITYNVSTPLPVCPHLDCQAAGWEHVLSVP